MPVPHVRVQVAFASAPDDPLQVWSDISADVRLADGITMTRGRSDEFTNTEPGRMSLTLDNTSGDYTFGYAAGAHYPNVKPRKRIRVSLSLDGVTWSPRFNGYVEGWPAEWAAGVTQQPRVRVNATDRLARFGLQRVLRDALHEELGSAAYVQGQGWVLDDATFSVLGSTTVLAGGVVWLYGLQESSGATTAGDVSGALGRPTLSATQVGAEGAAEFGTAGVMPEGTAVRFEAASAGNGLVLYSSAVQAYAGTEFSVWCQFAWSGSSGVTLFTLGTSPKVTLAATSTTVAATFTGTATATATKVTATNDNLPHFALVTVSGTTISLYVDEETAATATVPTGMGQVQGLMVGGTGSTDPHQVAWVGYANSAFGTARAAALGMLGSGGSERSDLRVARVLRWLGVDPDSALETGLSDIAYQNVGGAQALDLIADVNAVESGAFFPSGDGQLVFQSRDHRYNATVQMELDAADVDASLGVAVDASRLLNDYTVSRPRGATYRVRDEASIADYGEQSPPPATLHAANDDDLRSAAQWAVNKSGSVAPRIPGIALDLMTATGTVAAAALGLEAGHRVQLTGLPSATTPGGATVDLFAEGFEESVGQASWTMSIATSPIWGAVWALDDTTVSVLGTSTILAY